MSNKTAVWLAGTVSLVVVVGALFGFALSLNAPTLRGDVLATANSFVNALYAIAFGVVGALILARQRRNTIGWLLMAIGFSLSLYNALQGYWAGTLGAAPVLDWKTLLFIWFSSWSWWLLIGPLLLMLLVFPTGHLLSARWRWVLALVAGLFVTFITLATAAPVWQEPNSGVQVPNPLGVIPLEIPFDTILIPWEFTLLTTAALCVTAVLLRYRRSGTLEREQLKWFLYACAVFIVVYAGGIIARAGDSGELFGLLFSGALLFMPVSIGIAILRYRLFDIDILIRRTLIYSTLTVILVLFYFACVVLLQQLLSKLTGEGSDLAIILSTLAIAALFNPLRARVQRAIDHRFYRRKYDAAQVLAAFGATVRDEVDLQRLTDQLLTVVDETMQPDSVSVWLRRVGREAKQ